jgi:hypothetical protein
MNRPKSEEPVELVVPRAVPVPENGFRWVRGESGIDPSRRASGLFLVAKGGGRLLPVIPPRDLYLEFLRVKPDEASTLEFANRFGKLGTAHEHFHSTECSERFGESARMWGHEIGVFQHWFEVWQNAESRNLFELRKILLDSGVPLEDERLKESLTRDLVKTAKSYLVGEINRFLAPGVSIPLSNYQGCFYEGCSYKAKVPKITEHVSCELVLREERWRVQIGLQLIPDKLLTTVWLQFAELVAGGRRVRPCDLCGQWMDISETARPGAKRIHERCSLARRMRKWRAKRRG